MTGFRVKPGMTEQRYIERLTRAPVHEHQHKDQRSRTPNSIKKVFDRIQFNSFVEIMQNIPRNKGEQPWQE